MLIARVTMATKTWKGCATNDMTMLTMTMTVMTMTMMAMAMMTMTMMTMTMMTMTMMMMTLMTLMTGMRMPMMTMTVIIQRRDKRLREEFLRLPAPPGIGYKSSRILGLEESYLQVIK